MITIYARINSNPVLDGTEASQLAANIKSLGVNEPINVFDFDNLTAILSENKDKEIVLFSNFPPNSSYPHVDGAKYKDTNAWVADSYSISEILFEELNKKFKIKAMHFISGAPFEMLKLDFLQKIFPESYVTLKRNKDFIDSKLGFEKSYRNYIVGRIKESL